MKLPVRLLGRARVAAWPVLELLVSAGVQILLTPLLLHRLGSQQFGVWVLVQTALLAAAALSLGASAGLLPVLSAALHRGDVAGARAAVSWLFRRVAGVAGSVLVCVVIALAAGWTPGVPAWAAANLWSLSLAGLAWVVSTELDNAAASALKAQGRFGTAARSEVAARVIQLALVAALVGPGDSALMPILLSVLVTVAKFLVRLAALRPQWRAGSAAGAAGTGGSVARELAITGLWVWIGALGSLAFNAFDRWFVGAWFGASTLAAYAICTQLTQLPHAIVAAAGQILVPWAARPAFQGSRPSAGPAGMKLLVWSTALSALPSLLLLPLLEPVLGLWISPDFAREHLALAQGLGIAFLVLCLNVPAYFLLLGMGQARFITIVVSVCGLLFVLGALALPHDLSVFVVLKGAFAVLALGLPLGCALRLRARQPTTPDAGPAP